MISYRWTDGSDPAFHRFYLETEAYYNRITGGEENRKAFIPHNISENISDVLIDTVVGCAGLKRYNAADAEIKRVWVEPPYRNRHIARGMMIRLEQKALEGGYSRTILQTREIMADAVALYEGLGYHRIPNYPPYDKLEGAICFARELQNGAPAGKAYQD